MGSAAMPVGRTIEGFGNADWVKGAAIFITP